MVFVLLLLFLFGILAAGKRCCANQVWWFCVLFIANNNLLRHHRLLSRILFIYYGKYFNYSSFLWQMFLHYGDNILNNTRIQLESKLLPPIRFRWIFQSLFCHIDDDHDVVVNRFLFSFFLYHICWQMWIFMWMANSSTVICCKKKRSIMESL